MKIKSVKIKNFFCYLDEVEFSFGEGLNIISASNGGGKSQLFNAFYWVFFNQIYTNIGENSTKKKWKSVDDIILCPDYYITNLDEGETIETSVEIKLVAPHFNQDLIRKLIMFIITLEGLFIIRKKMEH